MLYQLNRNKLNKGHGCDTSFKIYQLRNILDWYSLCIICFKRGSRGIYLSLHNLRRAEQRIKMMRLRFVVTTLSLTVLHQREMIKASILPTIQLVVNLVEDGFNQIAFAVRNHKYATALTSNKL